MCLKKIDSFVAMLDVGKCSKGNGTGIIIHNKGNLEEFSLQNMRANVEKNPNKWVHLRFTKTL